MLHRVKPHESPDPSDVRSFRAAGVVTQPYYAPILADQRERSIVEENR